MEYASLGKHILSFSEMSPFSLNVFIMSSFPSLLENKRIILQQVSFTDLQVYP
jgi:hypothetical protein